MEINTQSDCPDCGAQNMKIVEIDKYLYMPESVVLCDVYDGGCGNIYVIKPRAEIKCEVYKIHKIKPQED